VRKFSILISLAIILTGCATKNYGRQGMLTDFEKTTMSCRELELEEARVMGFLAHIDKESEFDGRSVLSFLGDLGIGNMMEKDGAVKSANERLAALHVERARKNCSRPTPA